MYLPSGRHQGQRCPPDTPTQPMRVLLIDPSEGFRKEAKAYLEAVPFIEGVEGAPSVEYAQGALAGPTPPDVVMLALSGRRAAVKGALRRVGRAPSRPRVVALTVFNEPEYSVGLRGSGAHEWLPKSDFAAALAPCLRRLRWSPDDPVSDSHPPMASEVPLEAARTAGR